MHLNQTTIRSGALFLAFLDSGQVISTGLQDLLTGINIEDLRANFAEIVAGSIEDTESGLETVPSGDIKKISIDGSILELYSENLTKRAKDGKIDPILGRDVEIEQMIQILCRRKKSNPIMLGEPGVGKTAVVEGLALRVAEGNVPEALKDVQIFALDLGSLLAGTKLRGEFEQRLKGVINEVSQNPHTHILFIDEVHTIIGAGSTSGGGDAANLLKPALARGGFRVIAATTFAEYNKYFSKDAALERRFQQVVVDEPDDERAMAMLRGIKSIYEKHHGIHITDGAIEAAVKLSRRYIAGRQLPDKAVDLLDSCSTKIRMGMTARPIALQKALGRQKALALEVVAVEKDSQMGVGNYAERLTALKEDQEALDAEIEAMETRWQDECKLVQRIVEARIVKNGATNGDEASAGKELEKLLVDLEELQGETPQVFADVTEETVAQVIESWTGIPVSNMTKDEMTRLQTLEDELKKRVVGQDHAIVQVADVIRRAKVGLGKGDGPIGVFLFLGTSGVGKTELARAVAEVLFGDERFMVTLNMTEYQDKASSSRLIGAAPGLVGYGEPGALSDPVRRRPYSVVLLDEIEKANSSIIDMFMQVFDRGMLTDSEGRFVDFSNTLIFMTSNANSNVLLNEYLEGESDPDVLLDTMRPFLNKTFRPEFLGRVKPVVFLPLSEDVLSLIVRLKLSKLSKRMAEQNDVELTYSDEVVTAITEACTRTETGARAIDAIIDRDIASNIASQMLAFMVNEEQPESLEVGLGEDGAFTYAFK